MSLLCVLMFRIPLDRGDPIVAIAGDGGCDALTSDAEVVSLAEDEMV